MGRRRSPDHRPRPAPRRPTRRRTATRPGELATALVWRIGRAHRHHRRTTPARPHREPATGRAQPTTSTTAAPARRRPVLDADWLRQPDPNPTADDGLSPTRRTDDPAADDGTAATDDATEPTPTPIAAAARRARCRRARRTDTPRRRRPLLGHRRRARAPAGRTQRAGRRLLHRPLPRHLGRRLPGRPARHRPAPATPRSSVGYAPASWTALTNHLRRHGATDERDPRRRPRPVRTHTGRLIDRFRDRLVFPIKAADPDDGDRVEIHGFIGRRNPTTRPDDGPTAGPKYLNTAETDLFTKGHRCTGSPRPPPRSPPAPPRPRRRTRSTRIAVTLAGRRTTTSASPRSAPRSPTPKPTAPPLLSTRPTPPAASQPGHRSSSPPTTTRRTARRPPRLLAARRPRRRPPPPRSSPHGKDPAELLPNRRPRTRCAPPSTTPAPLADARHRRRAPHPSPTASTPSKAASTPCAAQPPSSPRPTTRPVARPRQPRSANNSTSPTASRSTKSSTPAHAWSNDPNGQARAHAAERLAPLPPPTAHSTRRPDHPLGRPRRPHQPPTSPGPSTGPSSPNTSPAPPTPATTSTPDCPSSSPTGPSTPHTAPETSTSASSTPAPTACRNRTRLLPMTTGNTPHPQRAGGSPRPTASTPMQRFEPANRAHRARVGRPTICRPRRPSPVAAPADQRIDRRQRPQR